MGDFTYGQFVTAVEAEIARHTVSDPQFSPYGTGTTSNSPIIAISEAWGGYIGHLFTSRRYGFNNGGAVRNDNVWVFNGALLDAHQRVLEEFNPNLDPGDDPFAWIPTPNFLNQSSLFAKQKVHIGVTQSYPQSPSVAL